MTHASMTHDQRAGYIRGCLLVLFSGVVFSLGGLIVRQIETADAWQIVFYRSLAQGLALLLLLSLRDRGGIGTTFRLAGWAGFAGGACLATASICFIFSITHTTVANTLFLLSAAPFMAAIISRMLLGEPVRPLTWVTMTVAMLGITVMVGEGIALGNLFGNLTGLMTALGFAGLTVALRYGRAADMLPVVCIGGFMSGGVAGIVIASQSGDFAISAWDLWLCAFYGAAIIAVGLSIFTRGARHLPAAELALLSLTEVVFGPVWVWLVIDERPSEGTLLGGTILLAALVGHALYGVGRRRNSR